MSPRSNRPVTLALAISFFLLAAYYLFQQQKYSVNDITSLLENVEINVDPPTSRQSSIKVTNNNDPEILQKHSIEVKVNELLREKLKQELKYERDKLSKQADKLSFDRQKFEDGKETFEKGPPILVHVSEGNSENPKFKIKSYSFKTNPKHNFDLQIDGENNEVVILSSISQKFDDPEQPVQKLLQLIDQGIEYPHYKVSLSFLISDEEEFPKYEKFFRDVFNVIGNEQNPASLTNRFSKVTLLSAQFIEKEFKIDKGSRHTPEAQKKRRRLLSRLRNFLVFNGIGSEIYSLSIDSDVIELPKNLLSTFIKSQKDIATIRIDIKNPQGEVVHADYDLNSWAGDRRVPNTEEDKKLDEDPDYFFEPRPGRNPVHFYDVYRNPEQFNIDPKDPEATFELNSVGGAVLFVKTEVFKQGVMFPPYYLIGTKWERKEGYDGIETEGLCYQAKTIGYSCWGFPNLVGYHSVA